MSLVFTVSDCLVNFTHFACLQFSHILTFAFLSKIVIGFYNYICYLPISSYADKFYKDYITVVIKVAKFSMPIFKSMLKKTFCW